MSDPHDKDSDDKTTKFYKAKSYYENMNYWHEDDHEIWYDSVSSGEPTDDIKDHLDTKDSKEEPTKDINSQTDKEAPLDDEEFEIWHDAQQKHKPFHLQ